MNIMNYYVIKWTQSLLNILIDLLNSQRIEDNLIYLLIIIFSLYETKN